MRGLISSSKQRKLRGQFVIFSRRMRDSLEACRKFVVIRILLLKVYTYKVGDNGRTICRMRDLRPRTQENSVSNEDRNDPMIVVETIARFKVKRILIYSGSIVEVLTWDAYLKIGLKEQDLRRMSLLYGFANHLVEVKRYITLPVALGDGKHNTTEYVQFFVVDNLMAYNVIFECPIMRINKMMIATRTVIGFMKSD
ncbi:hypothetical protein PVK06_042816 [Gossypium arboreum]|uniref:Uncharacterized protein n=1 Tax=Gossypium arboreum TaxID=29729 RepID=A0ABR0MM63_GOSAR|nr:hypothetical protein PVK06_042816 [Gossypium arboreum]